MDILLKNIPAGELLRKFGTGSHKPGSGSAAALQGMLSAQLIRTVIDLTKTKAQNPYYNERLPLLLRIDSEIESRIYPALEELFQKDSTQFDKVITLRQARDKSSNLIDKQRLNEDTLRELKLATELPIEIANLCTELAQFSMDVFDMGFKSARGDSGVAMSSTISAITGCLSIIDLNLLSLPSDEFTESIRSRSASIRSSHELLSAKIKERLNILNSLSQMKNSLSLKLKKIMVEAKNKEEISNEEIENIATSLQLAMWENRELIWKYNVPTNPIGILRPEEALKHLQFQTDRSLSLGTYEVNGILVEVAGQIDQNFKLVSISEQFPREVQNFTAAHELGHALLHTHAVLHRDRPLDGSIISGSRPLEELQADKFAAYFLMPKKQIVRACKQLFLTELFIVTEETAFALNEKSPEALRKKCRDKRGLARLLASSEFFNGKHFISISKQFQVSVEAMAIRLEELNLLDY